MSYIGKDVAPQQQGTYSQSEIDTQLEVKANLASPTFTGTVASISKAMVGLGNVDNTTDDAKSVLSATKLTTARTIGLSGDITGSVSFDGSTNVTITTLVGNATVTATKLASTLDLTGKTVKIPVGSEGVGRVLQMARATDKGASTNSGNWYFNYLSTPAYNAGFEVCSTSMTMQKTAGTSEIILMSQGVYSEEEDNTDGWGGIGISYYNNTTATSGWVSTMFRGRQTYSTYFENIGDSGVCCNGKMTSGWAAGNNVTFYLRAFNNFNGTKVLKTGHVPASSHVTSSTSMGNTAYKSWLVAMEVAL